MADEQARRRRGTGSNPTSPATSTPPLSSSTAGQYDCTRWVGALLLDSNREGTARVSAPTLTPWRPRRHEVQHRRPPHPGRARRYSSASSPPDPPCWFPSPVSLLDSKQQPRMTKTQAPCFLHSGNGWFPSLPFPAATSPPTLSATSAPLQPQAGCLVSPRTGRRPAAKPSSTPGDSGRNRVSSLTLTPWHEVQHRRPPDPGRAQRCSFASSSFGSVLAFFRRPPPVDSKQQAGEDDDDKRSMLPGCVPFPAAVVWNLEDLFPPSERFIFNFNSKDEVKKWHLY